MQSLDGKVAIITGASSGVGLSTAKHFLSLGAFVFGVDVSSKPESLEFEPRFAFLQCNLIEPSAPSVIVKTCGEAFGERVDILLNIAGVMDAFAAVDTLRDDDWDRVIAVNLTAPVKLMREVVPVMKKHGGGSIINVSSKSGMSGVTAGVAYTASKHGLVGATKNVAWQFKDEGIKCNAICPGVLPNTNIMSGTAARMDTVAFAKCKPIIDVHFDTSIDPARISAQVNLLDEVASLMAYLSSDANKSLTGAIIPVDNAWSTI